MNLADALVPKTYEKGSRIIKQGDAADGMYFIEDGTVSIRIQQESGETEISVLGKGQYFGELALVTHRARAASAYAVDTVKVACKFISDDSSLQLNWMYLLMCYSSMYLIACPFLICFILVLFFVTNCATTTTTNSSATSLN